MKLYLPFTVILTAVFVVLAGYVLARAQWGYQPGHPLHGTMLWATLADGLVLVASAPLSYNNSADFSRYLPRATSPTSVAGWTALGAFVPSVAFTALGALAGTALDMTDPRRRSARSCPAGSGPRCCWPSSWARSPTTR